MPTAYGSIECRYCEKQRLSVRRAPNHLLHLVLTSMTFGLWMIVWVCLWLMAPDPRCSVCGTPKPMRRPVIAVWLGVAAIAAFIALVAAIGTGWLTADRIQEAAQSVARKARGTP